jgi:DNA (cytosine-5)-methyltransferase 1
VGLFAGIGGLDLGFEEAGHQTILLAEWDAAAQAVLREHFEADLRSDVSQIKRLPKVDLITGGFPCQDISQAGQRGGLAGSRSGLVWEYFRLIERSKPEFFVLENVGNLLRIDRGGAMRLLLSTIEGLGYRWAYRLIDTRGFGIPQRRQRVIVLASRGLVNPEDVLLVPGPEPKHDDSPLEPQVTKAYGFYWTEGRRGVGWTQNAVPTIKGGSGLGIPSPPALYVTRRRFAGTPSVEDGERLQGFIPGWTNVELDGKAVKVGTRWRMIGNAVSVPVSRWIGTRLALESHASLGSEIATGPISGNRPLPQAAFGSDGSWSAANAGTHVEVSLHEPIMRFLRDPLKSLSAKALTGYLNRAQRTTRRIPARFLQDLTDQLQTETEKTN